MGSGVGSTSFVLSFILTTTDRLHVIFHDEDWRWIYLRTTLGLSDDAPEFMACGWMKNEERRFESEWQRVASLGPEDDSEW